MIAWSQSIRFEDHIRSNFEWIPKKKRKAWKLGSEGSNVFVRSRSTIHADWFWYRVASSVSGGYDWLEFKVWRSEPFNTGECLDLTNTRVWMLSVSFKLSLFSRFSIPSFSFPPEHLTGDCRLFLGHMRVFSCSFGLSSDPVIFYLNLK